MTRYLGIASKTSHPVHYNAWNNMWQRCTNPKDPGFSNWGGRGIVICERWGSLDAFIADMGPRPEGKYPSGLSLYSLDRINNDGNYEPRNCRWATRRQQQSNRRACRPIEWEGQALLAREWSERTELTSFTISHRIRRGWTPEKTLSEPLKMRKRFLTLEGRTLSIREWAERLGTTKSALKARLYKGMSTHSALTIPFQKYRKRVTE